MKSSLTRISSGYALATLASVCHVTVAKWWCGSERRCGVGVSGAVVSCAVGGVVVVSGAVESSAGDEE